MELFVQWICNVFACTKKIKWIPLFQGITMESFAQRICNGLLSTKKLQWILLYKTITMESFVQMLQWNPLSMSGQNRAHLIAKRYITKLAGGITMECWVWGHHNRFFCAKVSQWNPLYMEFAMDSFVQREDCWLSLWKDFHCKFIAEWICNGIRGTNGWTRESQRKGHDRQSKVTSTKTY